MNYLYYIPLTVPCNFSFRNCCAAVKEKEKQLAKMCIRSAKNDFLIYEYILHDLKIFAKRCAKSAIIDFERSL